jgi:hypothetical protein
MNSESDPKLASQIDAALKSMPLSQAPPSLLPAVLARIEARSRQPWWRLSWWNWPMPARAAFAGLAVILAAVLSGGGFALSEKTVTYSKSWTDHLVMADFQPAFVDPLWKAGHLVCTEMLPLLHYGAIAAGVLYLICLGLGTACFRFAVKHA